MADPAPDHDDQPGGVELRATVESGVVRQLDEVTDALDGLARDLANQEDLPLVLARLCRQVVHAIPGAELASITVRDPAGRPLTIAATHDDARDLDGIQHESGQGPGVLAAEAGAVVRVNLVERAEHWPVFRDAATARGVASVLAAPLYINTDYHGSLNLYGEKPHGYRKLDAALLELYTTAAEAALQAEQRGVLSREHIGQLRDALLSRAVIDQAKGIIMALRHVDADEAFAALVSQSQRENRKLREVAQDFVNTVTRAP